MEMDLFPGKIWVVSHKPVAVAAGLGHMGIHRNVIHPKFGNFILLGTVLIDAEATATISRSLTILAWSASSAWRPVQSARSARTVTSISRPATRTTTASSWAVSRTGSSRSPTVETRRITAVGERLRVRVNVAEPLIRRELQGGLLFGRLSGGRGCDRALPHGSGKSFLQDVVRPLQEKEETVYVVPGSDAEEHVARRFPNKKANESATD